jgi:geranylgeranyl diphosphate synthase type II
MIKKKTASYTIIGPLELGAIIAGASPSDMRKIKDWGLPFGYAFQIWDDCMNISAPLAKQGKEFAGDIMEGKRTLILSHLLSSANAKEKRAIEKIYSKPRAEKTASDKKYILGRIRAYGSDAYAKEKARRYGEKALAVFLRSTAHLPDTDARAIIAAGIEFVFCREQ